MKRVIIFLCAVFTISIVHAQERADQPTTQQKETKDYRKDAGEIAEKLNQKLDLSSSQYEEVKEISMKKAEKAKAISERYAKDAEKKEEMLDQLMADYQRSIRKILNEDQVRRLEALVKEWQNE